MRNVKTPPKQLLLFPALFAITYLLMNWKVVLEYIKTPFRAFKNASAKTGEAIGENAPFWSTIRNFKPREFDSRFQENTGLLMDQEFIRFLDRVRDYCGFALHVSSGYRTKEHNSSIKNSHGQQYSARDSPHMYGIAADLTTHDENKTAKLVNAIVQVRKNEFPNMKLGVGVYGSSSRPRGFFVHVDTRKHRPLEVDAFWTGNQYPKGGYRKLNKQQIERFKKLFYEK